jgi:hypothetical protein
MRWLRAGWRSVSGLKSARMLDCVEVVACSVAGSMQDTALRCSLFFFRYLRYCEIVA